MNLKVTVRAFLCGSAFAGILSSCTAPSGLQPLGSPPPVNEAGGTFDAPRSVGRAALAAPIKKERTGIATGWGKEVESSMSYTDFRRATTKPKYVSMIRYNDNEGAREMGVDRGTSGDGMQKTAGGLLEWGMYSGWSMLDNYRWRGSRFVIGKKGRDYRLRLKNLSDVRLEVVLTVDGLDVIDGQSGSTKKRGYIIAPGKTLDIRGFRTSHEKVVTFRFSSVATSYANLRHGDTRNVGVVGLALFTERGREPGAESRARQEARPFAEAPMIRALE
ncbi:MAG: hypothetical protein ABF379_04715 [Akkermansiaceae bacterium]